MHAGDTTPKFAEGITPTILQEPVASKAPAAIEGTSVGGEGTEAKLLKAPAQQPAPEPTAPAQPVAPPPAGTPERTSLEAAQWLSALQSPDEGGKPAWQVKNEALEKDATEKARLREFGVETAAEADAAKVAETATEATAAIDRSGAPVTAGTEQISREQISGLAIEYYG